MNCSFFFLWILRLKCIVWYVVNIYQLSIFHASGKVKLILWIDDSIWIEVFL